MKTVSTSTLTVAATVSDMVEDLQGTELLSMHCLTESINEFYKEELSSF